MFIPEVVERSQKTISDTALLNSNNQPIIVNLEMSVATSTWGEKFSSETFWKNDSKKSVVFVDELIKKLTRKVTKTERNGTTLFPGTTCC